MSEFRNAGGREHNEQHGVKQLDRNHPKRSGRFHKGPHKARKHSQWRDVWVRLRKNKLAFIGMVLAILLVLSAVFAPVISPYAFDEQDIYNRFQAPSLTHLLGTDNFGRDLFTRVMYGGRTSLLTAVVALAFSVTVAIILGSVAGFYGGWVDTVIMRIVEVIQAVPSMMLAITISAALGSGVIQTAIAVGVSGIAQNVRLIRGQVLSIRSQEYVESAIATGSNNARIMFKQILPNALSPLIVSASMGIGNNITSISGLSFIGLGVQPPTAEWGNIMTDGLTFIRQFWPMAVFPGIAIMLTLFAFNCFGDGLRDALDPKLKK